MNKTKMRYFEKEDILHICISDDKEHNSVELSPNITAELNEDNELIGLEILEASTIGSAVKKATIARGVASWVST